MSSSAIERPFESSLRASLQMLEREQSRLYATLCEKLGCTRVHATVGGERVQIAGTGAAIEILPGTTARGASAPGVLYVESDLLTIDALLEGETSLLDVVFDDRVRLVGALDDLLTAHDALVVYLSAAVRCPSAPALLAQFRRSVSELAREPSSTKPERFSGEHSAA